MSDAAQGKRAGAGDSPARREPWFAARRHRFAVAVFLMVLSGIGAAIVEHAQSRAAALGFALGAVIFGSVILVPWVLLPRKAEDSHAHDGETT